MCLRKDDDCAQTPGRTEQRVKCAQMKRKRRYGTRSSRRRFRVSENIIILHSRKVGLITAESAAFLEEEQDNEKCRTSGKNEKDEDDYYQPLNLAHLPGWVCACMERKRS